MVVISQEVGCLHAELESTRLAMSGAVAQTSHAKEAATLELSSQLVALERSKEASEASAQRTIAALQGEKLQIAQQLSAQLQAAHADREADAAHMHAKIERLKRLQSAALAAGSARGRQLLYAESLKSPDLFRPTTLSWRGDDWHGDESQQLLHEQPSPWVAVTPRASALITPSQPPLTAQQPFPTPAADAFPTWTPPQMHHSVSQPAATSAEQLAHGRTHATPKCAFSYAEERRQPLALHHAPPLPHDGTTRSASHAPVYPALVSHHRGK